MSDSTLKYYEFAGLLQQQEWMTPACVGVDEQGIIRAIVDHAPADANVETVHGYAMPGFQNAHSHAFQYAMAGLAERHLPGSQDDFWIWRERMYECALSIEPDQVEAVAAMLYAEMLRNGYTQVAEFHYLHHDVNGRPYQHVAEMGERLLAAAATAGIKITLIPVFYQKGGFNKEPETRQRRFISSSIDEYLYLLDSTKSLIDKTPNASLGFGVHSLRAVKSSDVFKTIEYGPRHLPFHMHVAEQLKEVEDCVHHLKQRPVEWLLDQLPLNERFNLVHCTHLNDKEVLGLANTGANVVLCPGTEGNLGDGIFRLTDFARHYGAWTIGTDSQINLDPLEDLRWIDYAQRLITHKRNTFDDGASVLISKAILSGRSAMGNSCKTYFEIGQPFDAVIFDADAPLLTRSSSEHLLPTIVYTGNASMVLGTIVSGQWVVQHQRHIQYQKILNKFTKAVKQLS